MSAPRSTPAIPRIKERRVRIECHAEAVRLAVVRRVVVVIKRAAKLAVYPGKPATIAHIPLGRAGTTCIGQRSRSRVTIDGLRRLGDETRFAGTFRSRPQNALGHEGSVACAVGHLRQPNN